MTIRTTEMSVQFQKPFVLKSSERMYPAGAYRVLVDEELIDGLSFLAYRRVSTMMFVLGSASSMEMMTVDFDDLERARLRDVVMGAPEIVEPNS